AVPADGMRMSFTAGDARLEYKNTDLLGFDASFVRLFGSDMLFGEQIPEILNRNGVYTQLDADSLTIATNKFYGMKVMQAGGVPIPRSAYVLSTEETKISAEEFGYPVVLKLISGYGGEGVMRASNASDLGPFVDALTLFEQDICLQEYVENPGEDVRVIVIGDETFSYKRVAPGEDEWRSNISQGAQREEYDAPDETREIARTAARLAGFDICGVDIIETADGPKVIELNMSPGIPEETQEIVGADLADIMMAWMHEKVTTRASERGL
ncbi:MAG: RimK family alpha-L-glutamate ligase, partial [Candidatus Nanohaloarchaea archaeon]